MITVGCLLVLGATVIGPFTQQLVAIKSRDVIINQNTTVPICDSTPYENSVAGEGPRPLPAPLHTLGAIYSGLFEQEPAALVSPYYATGNCTFPRYQSLGVCSKCADLTSEVVSNGTRCDTPLLEAQDCEWRIAGRDNVRLTPRLAAMFNSTAGLDLLKLDGKDLAIIQNMTSISAPYEDSQTKGPQQRTAAECTLYFCINTYEGIVEAGQFSESVSYTLSTTNTTKYSSADRNTLLTPEICLDPDPTKCNYIITTDTMVGLRLSIASLVEGAGTGRGIDKRLWSSDGIRAIYGENGTFSEIDYTFSSIAGALTKDMRFNICNGKVRGDVWNNVSYIHIQWPWITVPCVLEFFSVVFFIATIIKTKNQYIWKSSPFALLFLNVGLRTSFTDSSEKECSIGPTVESMDKFSQRLDVQLSSDQEALRFIQADEK